MVVTNLFSVFDPSSSVEGYPLNWVMLFTFLLVIYGNYWVGPGRGEMVTLLPISMMANELFPLTLNRKPVVLLPLSVFMLVLVMNVLGILPWVFVPSSHISVTLAIAFPIWASALIMGVMEGFMSLMAHLVPDGTPSVLMPFMVLIESVSILIRPITLSVRLGANMIAGHLLLALIGGVANVTSLTMMVSATMGLVPLLVLESAVAMIQAYVLTVLVTLYLMEV